MIKAAAFIVIFIVTAVKMYQSDKARERRRAKEKKIGKQLEQILNRGTLNVEISARNWHKIEQELKVKDALKLELTAFGTELTVKKDHLEIGEVSKQFGQYAQLLEARTEDRPCECICIRFHQGTGPYDSSIGVSFRMLDIPVAIR